MIIRYTIPFIISMFIGMAVHAQQGWEIGGWAGASHYFGDLNTSYRLTDLHPAGGVVARYNFNKRLCLKFSGNYTKIAASDSDSDNVFEQQRNLSFESQIFDGTAQLEFNFLPYEHGSYDDWFTPYMFAGFSFFDFNPKAELDGETYELRDLGTEGQFRGEEYKNNAVAFTFGGGFKFDINYKWSVNIELSSRKSGTDYLDDVSGTYPDLEDVENLRGQEAVLLSDRSPEIVGIENAIGEEGRQRGNSKNNDIYATLGVGIVYYFGQIRCPQFYQN
jgi:opacity protein-like surface antigen